MPDRNYEVLRQKIKAEVGQGVEPADILWTVADASAALFDGLKGVDFGGITNFGLQSIYCMITLHKSSVTPNPWFVLYGFDDLESPATEKYIKERGHLNLSSSAFGATTAVASAITVVDVGAIAQHGNAATSTLIHLVKFKAQASAHKQSQTLSQWIDLIIRMKSAKVVMRSGQLGASFATGIGSIVASLLATAAKLGIKTKTSNICMMVAMELHWRAYQESVLLKGASHTKGPAGQILAELFERRGFTRVFDHHNVKAIIQEPAGWMAIADKLMLI